MRALTLHQPWASLIALRVKMIETRDWATGYRGPLAIHAGKKCIKGEVGAYSVEQDNPRRSSPAFLLRGESLGWPYRLPLGAVIAVVNLVDCVPMHLLGEQSNLRRIEIADGGELWLSEPDHDENGEEDTRNVTDQGPYGDFAPGRFAWLLEDIRPIIPVAAVGHQQIWNWNA